MIQPARYLLNKLQEYAQMRGHNDLVYLTHDRRLSPNSFTQREQSRVEALETAQLTTKSTVEWNFWLELGINRTRG
jgi:hypothetical protein